MKTSFKLITSIQNWRLAAITIGSALGMAFASTTFGMGGPPPHSAPTAIATSSPAAVWEGDTVTVDASLSHTNPCCTALTYVWQGSVSYADNHAVTTTYIAQPVPLAQLTQNIAVMVKVTDDLASGGDKNITSPSVTTTVYASPVAVPGPSGGPHVNGGTFVMLSGNANRVQPTGTIVGYTWIAPAGCTLSHTYT